MLSSEACVDAISVALVSLGVRHDRVISLCHIGTERLSRTLSASGFKLQRGQRMYPFQTEVRELYLMGLSISRIAEIMTANFAPLSRCGVYKVLSRTGTDLSEGRQPKAETVVRLYLLGRTILDIVMTCQINKVTLYRYLDAAGIPRRQPHNHGIKGRTLPR